MAAVEKSNEWKEGYELGKGANYLSYKEKFGKTPKEGGKAWVDFLQGGAAKEKEKNEAALKELKYYEFRQEYLALCEKYNVTVSMGCGCCDGGAWMSGIEINVETE